MGGGFTDFYSYYNSVLKAEMGPRPFTFTPDHEREKPHDTVTMIVKSLNSAEDKAEGKAKAAESRNDEELFGYEVKSILEDEAEGGKEDEGQWLYATTIATEGEYRSRTYNYGQVMTALA